MATIIFTALGTLIGGPIGGVIGAAVGGQIDNAVFSSGGNVQGPRLADLAVSTSSYGATMPRHYGAMRVAGAIIWATDLVEHSANQGGGKGSPSATTYSYTTSFAVALASRPLLSVGRVWADGTLLRGTAGDLKVGGTMRFYPGDASQAPDPLIASAQGAACPGFRGRAYVVFEDLDLTTYGNRIPALTFEVFADDLAANGPLNLAQLFDGLLDEVVADVPLTGIAGFSCEGSFKDTLAKFQPVLPILCDADGLGLTIAPALGRLAPVALGEAASTERQGEFGAKTGVARSRAALPVDPPRLLRYYDTGLNYQPGAQRALGQPTPGKPITIPLPAAMSAANAFALISQAATNANWARETIAWRDASLDPAVGPGATVTVPGEPGQWTVQQWEWRAGGVEMQLERLAPANRDAAIATAAGKAYLAPDLPVEPSVVAAYHLPWTGSGSPDTPAAFAAVSSAGAGWQGAAIYLDQGNGALSPLGQSRRVRATVGTALAALAPASPLMFDRVSSVAVQLAGPDMALTGASADQLVAGANQALLGTEIIQFANATSQGGGVWALSGLLRGRGGTEGSISGHTIGEALVLLDTAPVALNPALIGTNPASKIAALGLGDTSAAESAVANWGITLQPLSPVHPAIKAAADGSITLGWTRRARGAYVWSDGVDVPLVEETEAYAVDYGPMGGAVASWTVIGPALSLDATTIASLRASLPGGSFTARQIGRYALSAPLLLTRLT